MADTLEIHTRMEGIPVRIVEGMIKLGIASNKTEAIRLAILDYDEHHTIVEKLKEQKIQKSELSKEEEKAAWLSVAQESLKKVWDNPKDDEVWSKY